MTELPTGWAPAQLGEVAEWSSGGTPRAGTPAYYGGNVPWAVIGDLNDGRVSETASTITPLGLKNSSAKIVDAGTVLVAMYGSIGKLGIAQIPMATNQAIACAVPSRAITRDWLFWWLRSQRHELLAAGKGGTQSNISQTVLKAWPIPIAPRPEQEQIVTAIEEAFSKLDAGEAGLRTVRQLLKRMRDAILTAAVTGRLVPQDPTDTPAAKLLADLGVEPHAADVPTGWALTTVGSVFRVAVGTTPRRDDPSMWGGEVWWVSSGEVAFNRIRSTRETITSKAVLRDGRVLPAGTVLLAMIGEGKTRGQPAILDVPAAHNQNCASIRVEGTGVSSEWVYTFLASRYSETRRAGSGNNQPALNKRLIEAIEIPIPPPEEQARIVAEVERQTSFLEACERAVDVGLARAAGLRRSVLKAAFEGRLVPQDPSDEPASVLLDRIRAERSVQPVAKRRARQSA